MQITKQLESGEDVTMTNAQYIQQLKDEMSSYSKKQDKVMEEISHGYMHIIIM